MPQTQSAQEIVSAPGFWDQPEKKQIEALSSANPQFKGASPEVQRGVLQKARTKFAQMPSQPPSAAPVESHVGPPSTKEGNRTSLKGEPSGGNALLEFARPGLEKVGGAVTGAMPKLMGAPKGASEFSTGFGKGLADVGVDMSNPLNIGLGAAMLLPESWMEKVSTVPKAAKLLKGIKAIGKYGFTSAQALDAIQEVPEAYEAYQKGDYTTAGQATAKALSDLILIKMASKSGKPSEKSKVGAIKETPGEAGTTTVKMGDRDIPVSERSNPELAARAVEAKKAIGKPAQPPAGPAEALTTPEQIERRVGEIQDRLNHMPRGTPADNAAYDALEAELRRVQSQHPSYTPPGTQKGEQDPFFQGRRPTASSGTGVKPAGPPEQIPLSKESGERRAAEAKARSEAPRKPVGDLGYRVAPEETGELPAARSPESRPVSAEKAGPPAAPPDASIPDGTQPGAGSAGTAQQFTADKLPGVPKGSTVIFREVTPQGTKIDIVDPSGRTTQATLPYRDSVKNMEGKGWIKAKTKPAETFETQRPAPPPSPAATPVEELRPDTRSQRALPGPGGGTPVPGAIELMTPQELGHHTLQKVIEEYPQKKSGKPTLQIPGPPDASGSVAQAPMSVDQQIELAKNQPPEVIGNFVAQMQKAFLDKLGGRKISDLPAEETQAILKEYSAMAEYLKPFEAIAKGGSPVKAETTKPPSPPKPPTAAAKSATPPRKSALPPKASEAPKKKALTPPVKPASPAQPPGQPAEATLTPPAKPAGQEMSQVVSGIFDTAKAQDYPQIKIVAKNRAGKELVSQLFDSQTPPQAVADALAAVPGVHSFEIEPQGGVGPKTKWTKFLTGRADAAKQ